MKLYTLPDTCSLAPNIAIAWADAPIDVITLERGQQKEDAFLTINPKGQVPALVFDDGEILTETTAILQYLGDVHGGLEHTSYTLDKKLGRQEAAALSFLSSEIHATFKCHFAPHLFANGAKNEKAARHKAYWRLDKYFETLHEQIGKTEGPWLLERKSYADAYLYIIGRWLEKTPMDISDYPNLLAHQQEMEQDSGVLLALERQNMTPANRSDEEED